MGTMMGLWRRLIFHPVAYCLYQKTKKGTVTWKKDLISGYYLEDGGICFVSKDYDAYCALYGRDIKTDKLVFSLDLSIRGPRALHRLLTSIENKPIVSSNYQRMKQYLKENC
jgi:hypothetical protein